MPISTVMSNAIRDILAEYHRLKNLAKAGGARRESGHQDVTDSRSSQRPSASVQEVHNHPLGGRYR
jgi:hypothetical protein